MKLLKSVLLLVFVAAFTFFAGAQDTLKQPTRQESASKGTRESKGDSNKDFDSHMAKFQQSYSKMKSQEGKIKDPKMKTDMDALIAKMSSVNSEYSAMKNNTGMTEQQQGESRKHIQSGMKEVRKMRDEMREKYGDEMGGKAKKSKEQNAPSDDLEPNVK